ncbi:MAG: PBP1A family penicillin-binding protein [Candidatus Neomarinimicrobiota bacterium]
MLSTIKKSILITVAIFLFIALVTFGSLFYFSRDLPSLEELEQFEPDIVSTVYSSDGKVLTEFGIKNRTLVPLDSIPDYIKNAVLATEDQKFFNHWGMDMRRFIQAVYLNIVNGFGSQGASTLTQQLARTLHLNRQETIKRKVQELIVAILIERSYSKTEILEMYLNSSFWGHGCYGIQAATDYYFSKKVQDLTLDESAMLIGILPAPTRFSPRFYHDKALWRRNIVLRNMVKNKKITQQEFMDALSSETPVNYIENMSIAPYFTEYVRLEVARYCRGNDIDYYRDGLQIYTTLNYDMQKIARKAINKQLERQQDILNESLLRDPDYLMKLYKEYFPKQELPLNFFSDYSIIAITPKKNKVAQNKNSSPYDQLNFNINSDGSKEDSLLSNKYDKLVKYRNTSFYYDTLYQDTTLYSYFINDSLQRDLLTFDQKTWYTILVDSSSIVWDSLLSALPLKPKTVQASLFSMDPSSGAILSMIGGRNFEESKFNRAVQAQRQPGSTFKPFVYTSVIDNGYSPSTQLLNQPPAIPQPDGTLWIPKNFDNSTGGLMTLRNGLQNSINLIAANAITQLTTPEVVIDYAQKMGISSELPAYPSLALGSGEVLLSDMVSAYSVFANKGIWNSPYAIERILDRNGREIYRSPRETREILSAETTYLMVDMLKSVIKYGTGRALARDYNFTVPIGGKTGTTNNYTDAWFVGFTPLLASGVWVGIDDARIPLGSMQTGSKAALPIWADFMTDTYNELNIPAVDFEQPATVRKFKICKETKLIPTPFCPVEYELFNVRYAPKEECQVHGYGVQEQQEGVDF